MPFACPPISGGRVFAIARGNHHHRLGSYLQNRSLTTLRNGPQGQHTQVARLGNTQLKQAFHSTSDRFQEESPSSGSNAEGPEHVVVSRARTFVKYAFYLTASTVVSVVALATGVFLHDALTYTERVSLTHHLYCCFLGDRSYDSTLKGFLLHP